MGDTEGRQALIRGGALDALRFAAAAFITLYHFGAEEAPRTLGSIHPVFERGFLATDFFLLLSGYVLARTYGPRLEAGRVGAGHFLVRRLARVWPAHILVLAAFALLVLAAGAAGLAFNHPEAYRWDAFARQAVLVHAWGLGHAIGWNSATWTLSALVVCYAGFPVLWRGLAALRPTAALAVGVGGLAIADALAQAAGADLYRLDPAIGLGRGLPLFLLGAAVARYAMGVPPNRGTAWLVGVGGAGALIASQLVPGWSFVSLLALAAIILAAGTHAPRRPSRRLADAGALAFALFITHNLVGLVWFRALKLSPWPLSEPVAWTVWALVFPACFLAAWLFDRLIDSPIQGWLKPRLAGSGHPAHRAAMQPA